MKAQYLYWSQKMDDVKANHVNIYTKNINSYYSFLDWIKNNFDEKFEERKDIPTAMLIVLKKIKDDSIRQLSFDEKNIFVEKLEKLEKRIRSHYVKKENK